MNRFLLIHVTAFFGVCGLSELKAQTDTSRVERYLFWQQDVRLGFDDFNASGDSVIEAKLTPLGIRASASTGLWWVVDVPKKRRLRGRLLEQLYIAPAFDRSESYMLEDDSVQLLQQAMYFDINEVCARHARRQMKALADSMGNVYGTVWIMCTTIMADAEKLSKDAAHTYTQEVLVQRIDGKYDEWRREIDLALHETKALVTTAEDRERFTKGVPILPGYIRSPDLLSPMPGKQ